MLNHKKQIHLGKQKTGLNSFLFFNLPILPSNSFLQSSAPKNVLSELNVVSTVTKQELSSKNFRFSSSLKDFRSYRLVTRHKKQILRKKDKLKDSVIFINRLFKKQKQSSFFFIKHVKGGFMATSTCLTSFMPKSLGMFAKKAVKKQYLLNVKISKKKSHKFRFSSKFNFKINLVSSPKLVSYKERFQKRNV